MGSVREESSTWLVDLNQTGITTSAGAVTRWRNMANRNQSCYFDGTAYVSTPDSGALALTGAVQTWTFYGVAAADFTPTGALQILGGQFDAGVLQRSHRLGLDDSPAGALYLQISLDGATTPGGTINSTVAPSFTDGQSYDIRVVRVVSTGWVTFYTCPAGGTFAQLGGTITNGGAGPLHNGTSNLVIGSGITSGTADLFFGGTIQRFTLHDDTRLAASWDAREQSDYASSTLVSVGPELWTGATTLAAGWSQTDATTLHAVGVTSGNYALQTGPTLLSDNATYRISFAVSGYVANSVRVVIYGDDDVAIGSDATANGTYTEDITVDTATTSAVDTISFQCLTGAFTGTISNISVKQISTYTSTNAIYRDPYDLDTILGTAANLRSHSSGAMLLDGVSGSYASAPDSPANSVTGSITLIAYAALDDWTPPTDDRALIGKWGLGAGGLSYLFRVELATGKPELATSQDGTNTILSQSTVAPSFTDGTGHWVRVTLDVSGDVANYYTSDDPSTTPIDAVTWTLLGDADVAHVSTGIADTTSLLTIGAQKDAGIEDILNGQIHRAGIIAGTDPTAAPAVDFNPALAGRSATGLDSDTWFGAEMLTVANRLVTEWSVSGTGTRTDNGDDTITVDDQDADANQYGLTKTTTVGTSDSHKATIRLSAGTASQTRVLSYYATGGTAIYPSFIVTWSDPMNPDFSGGGSGTVTDVGGGIYEYTLTGTNNGTGNTQNLLVLYAAGSDASTTGSVIVHGDVSLQSQWELHGGAVIQNSGQDEVKSYGASGLETTVAPALITGSTTSFIIAKIDALDSTLKYISTARSDGANSPFWAVTAGNNLSFDAGTSLALGAATVDPMLLTARLNGDATTSISRNSETPVVGNAGAEGYDYGTLLASTTGANTLTGSIARHIIKPGKTNGLMVKYSQNALKRIHGL